MSFPYLRSVDYSQNLERFCPTVKAPEVSEQFARLWSQVVDRPWTPGLENGPALFGLNQVVVSCASGREGKRYAERARANQCRILARWGQPPAEEFWRALEIQEGVFAKDEIGWLEFLLNWSNRKARAAVLSQWRPRSELWSRCRKEAELLLARGRKEQKRVEKRLSEILKTADLAGEGPVEDRPWAIVPDLLVEQQAQELLGKGHWRKLVGLLTGGEGPEVLLNEWVESPIGSPTVPAQSSLGLYGSVFLLGALGRGWSRYSELQRQALQLRRDTHLCYLKRIGRRLQVRGWERAAKRHLTLLHMLESEREAA